MQKVALVSILALQKKKKKEQQKNQKQILGEKRKENRERKKSRLDLSPMGWQWWMGMERDERE
jgi:hypothetical protein